MVLSAPVGFGKTTLFAEWADVDERPFAWVSLDPSDNDPADLLTSIAIAVSRVRPVDAALFSDLAAPGHSALGRGVPRLVASLATTGRGMVLVLSNLHEITSHECRDVIGLLIDLLPDEIQVAVSSRHQVWLAGGQRRARGEVLEFGASDLALDDDEAAQLLRGMGKGDAIGSTLETLQPTEGWPVGLYLGALGARAAGPGRVAIDPSTPPRIVADFIRSEVLAGLSAGQQRFLRRSAVLDEVSAGVCDFVLDTNDSALVLDSLVQINMFIVPLDARSGWYRFHSLFRGVLIDDLTRHEADIAPGLHRRASEWWQANGSLERAIRHAMATTDVDYAARVLTEHLPGVYNSGQLLVVDKCLREFGDRNIEQSPALAGLAGVVAALCGRAIDAVRWAEQTERIDPSSLAPETIPFFDAPRAVLQVALCQYGVEAMQADAEAFVAREPEWGRWRPTAVGLLGMARWLGGDADGAFSRFSESIEAAQQLGLVDPLARMSAYRALVSMDRDDWASAALDVERARNVVAEAHLTEYDLSTVVDVASARLAVHRHDHERVRIDLDTALRKRVLLSWAFPWAAVWLRVEMADANLAIADPGGARILLREIDDVMFHRPRLGVLNERVEALRDRLTEWPRDVASSMLTSAELRLLPYLQTHLSLKEIGERLYISRNTVATEATAIFRKLRVSGRSAAVDRARELGLLERSTL